MRASCDVPNVTSSVQTPMNCARWRLKYVSVTTPLPMAIAGLMKNEQKALHVAMAA